VTQQSWFQRHSAWFYGAALLILFAFAAGDPSLWITDPGTAANVTVQRIGDAAHWGWGP